MKEINYDASTKMPKPFPKLRKAGLISPNGGEMSVFDLQRDLPFPVRQKQLFHVVFNSIA